MIVSETNAKKQDGETTEWTKKEKREQYVNSPEKAGLLQYIQRKGKTQSK